MDISVSIVIYNTLENDLINVCNSIKNNKKKIKITVIDNSEKPTMKKICKQMGINYYYNKKNIGYGRAHNISISQSLKKGVKYHIILNADVYFDNNVIDELYDYMETNKDVGLIMPKVLYPDGSLQYLGKLLPDPYHLLLRKIMPNSKIVKKYNNKYELRFTDYDQIMKVPLISGCFMFVRVSILDSIGLFDKRYFMYLEDFDLCRRINKYFHVILYPHTYIFHKYARGHARSFKLLTYFIVSAIRYFNKWGWIIDKERKEINQRTLKELNYF